MEVSLWRELGRFVETSSLLTPAHVGRGSEKTGSHAVRGDSILWLQDDGADPLLATAQAWMENLRHDLNEHLSLGLKRVEAHFALYPPGAGYDLHLDQHRGQVGRKITFLVYLNEDWRDEQGGELELHLESGNRRKISPLGGRLVLFRSELIPHQVHPAVRARKSLTGWFRDDDPPW
ncbi:MAG TPA: 2OG-Fe(II) oxygenase [Pseudobdellovibrionaceae bacterium]|nr:2OG-Fe(II) oxygenase [Pseudobdellovibrionaceae bacterium]